MKQGNDALLHLWLQVNEHIAARDQVHVDERRVFDDVMRRENDLLPNVFDNRITVVALHEIFPQQLRRDRLRDRIRIYALARELDRLLI